MKRYIKEYWPYLLALLPAMLLRDFSPASELRYVSIASELIEGHHFFCLQWQGEDFPYIMPLYVWLIALLKVILQHHYMFSITFLFSFIPSMVILGVMNRWVERYDTQSFRLKDGSQSRILASIMLFTSGMQLAMGFFVSPDMLFSMWIVLSLYTFWRLICGVNSYGKPSPDIHASHRLQWMLGIFVFLAILTKGPLGFILPMLSTTCFLFLSRRMKLWGRVWNWRTFLVLILGCSIWFYLTYREGGIDWVRRMFYDVPLSHFANAADHNRPWWYYLLSLWADSIPWGPVAIVVLIISLIRRIHHHQYQWNRPYETPLQNFFVSTSLLFLVYFSIRSYKLDVIMLPAYPFLIYAGVMQLGQWRWPVRWNWPIVWICRSVLIFIFVAGCLCPWLNINIGCYGRVCYRCNKLSRELKTEDTYTYRLKRVNGMDTYLYEPPIEASAQDIADGKLTNTLLIMKEYRLPRLRKELDALGVPPEKQGKVVSELGAFVILHFD